MLKRFHAINENGKPYFLYFNVKPRRFDKWRDIYEPEKRATKREAIKRDLRQRGLSPQEFECEIKRYCDEYGI